MLRECLLLALLALPLSAQSRAWRISVAVHIGGTAADCASSWGYGEGNPVLASRGTFGARGLSIRAAISGAAIAAQYIVLRRHHGRTVERAFIAANTALGATWGAVAAHNLAVRFPRATPQ